LAAPDWIPSLILLPAKETSEWNDYVNDKIQTAADLEDLDSLIAGVETQHKLLEGQVGNVTTKLLHL
jgi:hypothetical protein